MFCVTSRGGGHFPLVIRSQASDRLVGDSGRLKQVLTNLALWQLWNGKLPGTPFVRRQLAAASAKQAASD